MKPAFKDLLIDIILLFLLTTIALVLSFAFTVTDMTPDLLLLFFQEKTVVLYNFLPLFLMALFFYFALGKIRSSAAVLFLLVALMAVVQASKLHYRYENFKFADLATAREGAKMVANQFSPVLPPYFVPSVVLMVLIVAFLIWLKRPRLHLSYRATGAILVLVLMAATKPLLLSSEAYGAHRVRGFNEWVEVEDAKAHGLVYAFFYSAKDVLTEVPEGYDENAVEKIWKAHDDAPIPADQKINVVAVMLESFNDFSQFDLPFVRDPYESFHAIQNESIHGKIVNNMFGGGTAFVERYFLNGCSYYARYYKPFNSYVHYFKSQGYNTLAMHPHDGAFYNRRNVNPKLGFDRFYYMENYFKDFDDGKGYFRDRDLYDHLLAVNKKTPAPYFNFTVTMENHGPYDADSAEAIYIPREYFSSDANFNQINNYLHGIKDSGDALKALLARLNEDEAPTLFIAFGDHNPALGQETDGAYKDLGIDVGAGELSGYLNRCRTPYILWANRALKEKMQKPFIGVGPDLSPQYLMNYTFRYLGWTGPKYMQIMEEKLPEVTVVNDQVIKNEGRYLFSKDEEFDAVQQFVKSLDYYNNKHFYYFGH